MFEELFKKPKISILLPAFKSGKLLKEVFMPSFIQNTTEDVELLIWDNGGNEEYLNPYPTDIHPSNLRVFGSAENLGLNKALNKLAAAAFGEYFYLCHTDMFLLKGWDTALLKECKNFPPTSFLFCSRSVEPRPSHIPSQIIKDYGCDVDTIQCDKLMAEYQQHIEQKIVVNARMPFFMHRDMWSKIGGVDEAYYSFCTDDDLIQQCYDVKCRKFFMICESLVYHLSGQSNAKQSVDRDSQKPYEYFVNKWKNKYPDVSHPGQYHPRLIPFETRIK